MKSTKVGIWCLRARKPVELSPDGLVVDAELGDSGWLGGAFYGQADALGGDGLEPIQLKDEWGLAAGDGVPLIVLPGFDAVGGNAAIDAIFVIEARLDDRDSVECRGLVEDDLDPAGGLVVVCDPISAVTVVIGEIGADAFGIAAGEGWAGEGQVGGRDAD